MLINTTIDNSKNKWPGTTSIADIAINTRHSANTVGELLAAYSKEWKFEFKQMTFKHPMAVLEFRDGSMITFQFD